MTFDDWTDTGISVNTSTGAGTVGLDLGAGLSPTNDTTPVDELALPTAGPGVDAQVMVITSEAIAGQNLLLSNGSTVTVISDSTQKVGVAGAKNFETAIVTPNTGAPIAKKIGFTIEPTTTTPYVTFDGTVTSGSTTLATSSPEFSGTYNPVTGANPTGVGAPVSVEYYDNADAGYFSPYGLPENGPTTDVASTIVSITDSEHAVIGQWQKPSGTTEANPAAVNSQASGSVVVTAGATNQVTAPNVATDYDLAFTGCASSLHASAGVIYPNNVTLTTPAHTGTTGPGAATALEKSVLPITNASVNFPTGLPAGYSWGGGGTRTDSTNVTISSGSDSVADPSILATDAGKLVTGSGIPASTYVGTVTPNTSFLLSSSDTSQVNVNATSSSGTDLGSVTVSPALSTVTFNNPKDALNLSNDTESFIDGVVPSADAYTTPKASLSFGLGSVVACTQAQLQAINTGTGVDATTVPEASSPADVGAKAMAYCDGGTRTDSATVTNGSDSVTDSSVRSSDFGKPVSGPGIPAGAFVGTVTAGSHFLLSSTQGSQTNLNATGSGTSASIIPSGVSAGAAFGELGAIEADPSAQLGASDGTGLAAIWQSGGTGTATF